MPEGGISPGLTGFEAMAKNRGIDWGRFIDIGSPRAYGDDPDKVSPPLPAGSRRRLICSHFNASAYTMCGHRVIAATG